MVVKSSHSISKPRRGLEIRKLSTVTKMSALRAFHFKLTKFVMHQMVKGVETQGLHLNCKGAMLASNQRNPTPQTANKRLIGITTE